MQFPANLVTFTEEILHGKLHFLCSVSPAEIIITPETIRFVPDYLNIKNM